LAVSNVKIKAVDVMASIKMGTCLCLYPIYLFGFSFLFYLYCLRYLEWHHKECLEATIVFCIIFPLNSIIAIRSADGVVSHYKTMQARIIAFFHTEQMLSLKLMRKNLRKQVKETVNKIGHELFKNFDKLKFIMKEGVKSNQVSPDVSKAPSKIASPVTGSSLFDSFSRTEFEVSYQD